MSVTDLYPIADDIDFGATQPRSTVIKPLAWRRLSDVQMKSIEWLEKPLWQRSAFHLMVGKKGAGKGTYLAHLIAKTTAGTLFGEPMNALVIASEDSDEIDVKPRVVAAGGNPEKVISLVDDLKLPNDAERLRETALEIGQVGLIILDPVASHVRGDTHTEDPVRAAIDPLNGLADDLNCLLVGVRHLSKNTQAGAVASVLGSTAWTAVPRAVLAVVADDQEDNVFHIAIVAGNRSARGNGRTFRIEMADVGLKEPVTRAVEAGESSKSIDDLLAQAADQKRSAPKRESAEKIILRELDTGPKSMDHLRAVVIAETSSSGQTAWLAANALKAAGRVRSSNSGPGTPWLWQLIQYAPGETPNDDIPW